MRLLIRLNIFLSLKPGSSGGVVVKLLACEARGPGFDPRFHRYDFRDWLSPASKSKMAEILLKRHKSSKQPTKQLSLKPDYYHMIYHFLSYIIMM